MRRTLRTGARGVNQTVLDPDTYPLPQSWPVTVKVKVNSNAYVAVWIDGTQEIYYTGGLDIGGGP